MSQRMEQGQRAAGPGGFMGGRGPGHGPAGAIGRPVEKARDFKGTLKRLIGYLKPRGIQMLVVLVFAVASTTFSIVAPKIMGKATTRLFEGVMARAARQPGASIDFAYIGGILTTLGGLYVMSAFFSYAQQYLMAGVAQETVYQMRRDVTAKLNRLPLKYFDSRTHGEILSRITNDIDNISTTLQQSLTQLITASVTIAGIIIMMLTISPMLTLVTLVTLPLSVMVTTVIARRSHRYFAGQQRTLGEMNGHVEEVYTGHRIIKAFGREQASIQAFEATNNKLYEYAWKAQFISGILMPLMNLVNNLGYVIICVAGGVLVIRRSIEIGDVQAFINYSRYFTHPIIQTATIANIIQSTVASAERVFEIMDEPEEEPDRADARVLDSPRGEVRFEHVTFGYRPGETLIEDMNVDVKPGQMIAIAGPTGAGKTTLVNLLMRFYEIADGRITIDGIDIRDLRRGRLRTMFGMVLQDTWLFNGTIRDNIAYGREGATDQEVIAAARAARADRFIRALPDGYDTVLNEEGSNISQGQMQLLTIARAILADPAILILDEATSSVDTLTESEIQKAMKNLMKGRTSFVIAHRLSTIRDAERILVMNNGRIVEQGTHAEMLARGGFYADLYNSQFAGGLPLGQAG